ncbi:MAG: hypothetical protein ACI4HI_06535 [Lachnospiraceae bacterium]
MTDIISVIRKISEIIRGGSVMLKRLNSVLPELILELLIYGGIIELGGIFLVKEKLFFSIGLWIGIVTAIGMALHMAVILEDAVSFELEGRDEKKRIAAKSALRYIIVVVLFFTVAFLRIGDIIACFIGVMGLKAAAYLQPFTHKCILKLRGIHEVEYDAE